jgi:hypothetical protein
MPHLNKRGRIYRPYLISVFIATLVVFYYAFYRCHVKVWRSSRSFLSFPVQETLTFGSELLHKGEIQAGLR